MIKLMLVALLSTALSSCASLGTTEHVYTSGSLQYIKRIGLGPYLFHGVNPADGDTVYAIFDEQVRADLRSSGLFEEMQPFDSLKVGISKGDTAWTRKMFNNAKEQNLDGVLLCDLKLTRSSYLFIPITDADVTLFLYNSKDKELLLETKFSTTNGSSYWWPPSQEKIIRDATDEAVRAFARRLKEQPSVK